MCEHKYEFHKFDRQGFYRDVDISRLNQPNICQECGEWIPDAELNPPDHCSRSLHDHCFTAKLNRVNRHCIVCGADNSGKIHLQQGNWREIKHHICDDPQCSANWALMHAAVHGLVPQNVGPALQPVHHDSDVMDAEYTEVDEVPPLTPLEYANPNLLEYNPQPTIEELFSGQGQKDEADVVLVELPRRRT